MEGKRGTGVSAVWVARNRFAVLDAKTGQVHLKNLRNETSKTLTDIPQCDALFYAGTGKLLLRQSDKCLLYDTQQKSVLASVRASRCRYVVWSQDGARVALLGKHTVTSCDKNLKVSTVMYILLSLYCIVIMLVVGYRFYKRGVSG